MNDTRRRADYTDDRVTITSLGFTLARYMLECSTNKVCSEPKRCLILDVRISSLEVDLRVLGYRDEFQFS